MKGLVYADDNQELPGLALAAAHIAQAGMRSVRESNSCFSIARLGAIRAVSDSTCQTKRRFEMKRYTVLVLSLLWLLIIGGGCTTANRNLVSEAADGGLNVRIYEVFGMDCPGCHGAVEKLVKKVPGVEQAEANWEQQRLTVMVRQGSDLNDQDVYEAILQANFTPGKRIK